MLYFTPKAPFNQAKNDFPIIIGV